MYVRSGTVKLVFHFSGSSNSKRGVRNDEVSGTRFLRPVDVKFRCGFVKRGFMIWVRRS